MTRSEKISATVIDRSFTHCFAVDADGIRYFVHRNNVSRIGEFGWDDVETGSNLRLTPVQQPRGGWEGLEVEVVTPRAPRKKSFQGEPAVDPIQHAVGHWFTQGGKAQFGMIEASNADELIAAILRRVRNPKPDADIHDQLDPPSPALTGETEDAVRRFKKQQPIVDQFKTVTRASETPGTGEREGRADRPPHD